MKKTQSFHENELVLIEDNLPKHTLDEFEIDIHVFLRSGSPDMWILAIHGEKIECGWIENDESSSALFSYRSLSIKTINDFN